MNAFLRVLMALFRLFGNGRFTITRSTGPRALGRPRRRRITRFPPR